MGLRTAASVRIGEELPPLKKPIAQRQIDAYSGVRPKSIHTDAEWAKKKGFAAPLAQGVTSPAYVSQVVGISLGEGCGRGGSMSVAVIEPGLVGEGSAPHGGGHLAAISSGPAPPSVIPPARRPAGITRPVGFWKFGSR